MKKIILLSFVCLAIVTNSFGQPEPGKERKQPTPKEIAEAKTSRMDELLSLTDKQRKKIYKLNLKEAKEMQEAQESGDNMRPMGPPPGGGRGAGHDERPAMRDNEEFRGERPQDGSRMKKESEEDIAKRETKIKKILTEDQYTRWTESEKKRKHHEFQEKLLRDSKEMDSNKSL